MTLQRLNLTENPFLKLGVPRGFVEWGDRKEVKHQIENHATSVVSSGRARNLVINGTYGSGKTHCLQYFNWYVNAKLAAEMKERPPLSVVVKNPGESFVDLFCSAFEGISFEEIRNSAIELCSALVTEIFQKTQKAGSVAKDRIFVDLAKVMDEDRLARSILERFGGFSQEFSRFIASAALGKHSDVAERWLGGERISAADLKRIGVTASILTDDQAVEVFDSTIRLITVGGRTGTFILCLDEFEDIDELTRKEAISYLRHFRRFLDAHTTNFSAVIAADTDALERIRKTYEPMGSRLRQFEKIELLGLTREQIQKFIEDICEPYKLRKNSSLPFQKSAYDLFSDLTKGVPRDVVKLLHDSIELGSKEDVDSIDAKLVRRAARP